MKPRWRRSRVRRKAATVGRGRRSRNGSCRRSYKENCRPSRDKPANTGGRVGGHGSVFDCGLDVSFRESCHSLSQTSMQLKGLLMSGSGTRCSLDKSDGVRKTSNQGRWTIAVEVEDWAAEVFDPSMTAQSSTRVSSSMNLSTHW